MTRNVLEPLLSPAPPVRQSGPPGSGNDGAPDETIVISEDEETVDMSLSDSVNLGHDARRLNEVKSDSLRP